MVARQVVPLRSPSCRLLYHWFKPVLGLASAAALDVYVPTLRAVVQQRLKLVAADLVDIAPVARQPSLRYDRSISWRTATIGAWLPRIEIAAAPA